MSEQKRILEMIEKGQITASEAMDLLNALNEAEAENEINAVTVHNTLKSK